MRFFTLLIFFVLIKLPLLKAQEETSMFSVNIQVGPSFLSYGDTWGFDRGFSVQYGKKWFIRGEYSYSNYESSFYDQDFYKETERLTTETKYYENFFSSSSKSQYALGFKLQEVKDIINTINSFQIALGRKWVMPNERLSLSVRANIGIYQLTRVSPSIIIHPVAISYPGYFQDDVTLIGMFTNRFLDFSWGMGTECSYEVLRNRMSLDIFAKATVGDARVFAIGIGTSIMI